MLCEPKRPCYFLLLLNITIISQSFDISVIHRNCEYTHCHSVTVTVSGCHWSGKSQGNSMSGKSQGILEFVREIWNLTKSKGNLRKVREI